MYWYWNTHTIATLSDSQIIKKKHYKYSVYIFLHIPRVKPKPFFYIQTAVWSQRVKIEHMINTSHKHRSKYFFFPSNILPELHKGLHEELHQTFSYMNPQFKGKVHLAEDSFNSIAWQSKITFNLNYDTACVQNSFHDIKGQKLELTQ